MLLRPILVLSVLLAFHGFANASLRAASLHAPKHLPNVSLRADNLVVTQSCVLVIAPGTVIEDTDGSGVIQVGADNLVLRFAPGSVLRGAPASTPWDRVKGVGIRVEGRTNVVIEGARVHGFKVGLWASAADSMQLRGGDFSDNYRQRLKSSASGEDGSDWLFPHNNDQTPWREQYGAAVCVQESRSIRISNLRVRRGQNGILLDRVTDAEIYDNDCSFLSGWGLALWRSSRNLISRNAFDFCIRGHVEGVYNRGQDSAGILCFEQSNENLFLENSATHGGDGFFGFAGQEAIGERWMSRERDRLRRETGLESVDDRIRVPAGLAESLSATGCNHNVLQGNDFSYAAAHGIEMTFSEGNQFLQNRLVENAICGIWGGYSSRTRIEGNEITGNGGMAYGLERGGINMEHASFNQIVANRFKNNRCAIHLWWNDNPGLLKLPGVSGGEQRVIGNRILRNTFEFDGAVAFHRFRTNEPLPCLQLRDSSVGKNTFSNEWAGNTVRLRHSQAVEFALEPGCAVTAQTAGLQKAPLPRLRAIGRQRPVGARAQWRGRDQIIMDEWGPWDHESPLVRPGKPQPGRAVYEVYGVERPTFEAISALGSDAVEVQPRRRGEPAKVTIRLPEGVATYAVRLHTGRSTQELRGTRLSALWNARFFPWDRSADPRTNTAAWRTLADSAQTVAVALPELRLPYGGGGPKNLGLGDEMIRRGPGSDHFGMIATTQFQLPAGRWRLRTLSDDGVRVSVNSRVLLENWTWHGPTTDEAIFNQASQGMVTFQVEHFEIDGYATLEFDITPVE